MTLLFFGVSVFYLICFLQFHVCPSNELYVKGMKEKIDRSREKTNR
ncbi:hypothetical protein GLYMA_04G184850v4 [Glycine max]|nr:hypothetical protein GLYMA_04G184850v4 [Glycine max]KAH1111973.1 hypothetical protein GYH30_010364 [Glycine max]